MFTSRFPRSLIALGLALLATIVALFARGAIRSVDNILYDMGLTAQHTTIPDDIVILGIDEKFMEDRHAYMAPRDRLATLIRNLSAAKPKAIALDVWLDSRIDHSANGPDEKLKSALLDAKKKNVPVILSDVPPDQNDAEDHNTDTGSLTAHGNINPFFQGAARTGSVYFVADDDGVVRLHPREIPGHPYLPLQMALLAGAPPAGLKRLESGTAPIDFCGPPGSIEVQKAVDFLDPSLAPLLEGKLLFIGAMYQGSHDYMRTPYSQVGPKQMYGVEMLAQATDSLRRGAPRYSHETSAAVLEDFILVFLAAWVVGLAALRGTWLGIGSALLVILSSGLWAVLSARYIHGLFSMRFHPVTPFLLGMPLAAGGGIAWRSVIQGRELKRVRDTFGAYVGAQVLESLGDKMPELGGETRPIAVLFCDIRGYSALAESMNNDPKALLDELNAHFTPLVAALQNRGAYVDNYVGDLVMALFGAPFSTGSYQSDVHAAVLAALDFVSIIETRNAARREKGLFPIEVGIGVHCGEAVVGNMGSTDAQSGGKIHYTAIGDVVNVASRIESATRGQNVALLVTGDVVAACQGAEDIPTWARIGEVNVKGRAAAVEIYKVENGI